LYNKEIEHRKDDNNSKIIKNNKNYPFAFVISFSSLMTSLTNRNIVDATNL